MRISTVLAGATLAFAFAFAPTPSSAAPAVPTIKLDSTIKAGSGVEEVRWHRRHWRHRHWNRCRAWRNRCAARWGWGGWRYSRCVRRHAC